MIIDRAGIEVPVLVIIPARGGSKGVPRKNIRTLGGVPLIARTIRAALGAIAVDEVVVSTDDAEIAEISLQHGAKVVHRPAEISGDTASSESALLHVIEARIEAGWAPTGLLVFLQCTSPFTTGEDIDGTIHALVSDGADCSLAVAEFFHFVWRDSDGGGMVGINHDKAFRARRQDRDLQYVETGSVYAMDLRGFRQAKHRFFGTTTKYVIPAWRAIEIDDPVDFMLAEAILSARDLP